MFKYIKRTGTARYPPVTIFWVVAVVLRWVVVPHGSWFQTRETFCPSEECFHRFGEAFQWAALAYRKCP